MENVLAVYKQPFSKDYPVVCIDEPPRQLVKETHLPKTIKKGMEKRVDYEHARCGVCNILIDNF